VTRLFRLLDVDHIVCEAWDLGLAVISFFLVNAGIIFAIQFYDTESFYYSAGELSFFDCLYFVVISMVTVGYGDIVPHTNGNFV